MIKHLKKVEAEAYLMKYELAIKHNVLGAGEAYFLNMRSYAPPMSSLVRNRKSHLALLPEDSTLKENSFLKKEDEK